MLQDILFKKKVICFEINTGILAMFHTGLSHSIAIYTDISQPKLSEHRNSLFSECSLAMRKPLL